MRPRVSVFVALPLALAAGSSQGQPRPPVARVRTAVVQPVSGSWGASCVAQTGCMAPEALPRCPTVVSADLVPLAVAIASRGGRVMTQGRLRIEPSCQERACPSGQCCNQCSATLRIDAEGHTLTLGVENAPAFQCLGDPSGLCCASATPAGVVGVRGEYRPPRHRGGVGSIENPTLCIP